MLILNGKIITWEKGNRILEGFALYIKDGKIAEIGLQEKLLASHPEEERVDAEGQYVMPGNTCAHTHFYGAFSRGMAIPGNAPRYFPEILEKLWWPLDRSLRMEDVKYSALVCIIDAIKHGTTTLVDHHASPNSIPFSLDTIAETIEYSGIRANLCYEVSDRDGPEKAKEGIKENRRFAEFVQSKNPLDGRLTASFGLHASLTLSEKTLQDSRESAPGECGFHIHVAEHTSDQYDSLSKSGKRVVERLSDFGLLGPHSIAAHCVHIDAPEIQLLAESGTWVTHQPRSNMNNAVGLGDVDSLLRAGVKVTMGNDGFSNAMWTEWKAAYLAHKLWNNDPQRMNGMNIIQMGVYNNSEMLSTLFNGKLIGKLVPGAEADLIFVDYHPITPIHEGNLPWHILFGFDESMVTTTMVAGKLLMHKRVLLTMDEEKISCESQRLSTEVWQRYQKLF